MHLYRLASPLHAPHSTKPALPKTMSTIARQKPMSESRLLAGPALVYSTSLWGWKADNISRIKRCSTSSERRRSGGTTSPHRRSSRGRTPILESARGDYWPHTIQQAANCHAAIHQQQAEAHANATPKRQCTMVAKWTGAPSCRARTSIVKPDTASQPTCACKPEQAPHPPIEGRMSAPS